MSVVSGHYRNVLIGFDRQRVLLACTGLSALASATATAYFAGAQGAQGAALGLLIGNAVLAASTAWAVNQSVMPIGSWTVAWAPTTSAAVACAVLWFVRESNPYVAGAAAATVFAALFAAVERKELVKLGSELAARI